MKTSSLSTTVTTAAAATHVHVAPTFVLSFDLPPKSVLVGGGGVVVCADFDKAVKNVAKGTALGYYVISWNMKDSGLFRP